MSERALSEASDRAVPTLIRECAEPFDELAAAPLDALLDRIGEARVVLLGEASHGTSEFYRMRAHITRALIEQRGFRGVAVEADWPDAAAVDRYVQHRRSATHTEPPFARFPTWMWRNAEVADFVEWLRAYNEGRGSDDAVGFYGLDMYSMFASADAVIRYLDDVDPDAARIARVRYGCLSPWEDDPATYGRAAVSGRYEACEPEVTRMLVDLLEKRLEYAIEDGDRYLDALHNARLVASAERYYRSMYYGPAQSWNLRDSHMFETLKLLLQTGGPEMKLVVWEHNSHIGDARATGMSARGEHNVGQLCRTHLEADTYHVGFGTDHGTVAAAHGWGDPVQIMDVRPSHADSYERLCHRAQRPAFLLALRHPVRPALHDELTATRLERAIGVIYRPETELFSHYFPAVLPEQFDEYIYFDESHAVQPLERTPRVAGMPETYPFGV